MNKCSSRRRCEQTITNVIESIFGNTSEFNTQILNDDDFNSVYEKTMKEYNDKKEESMMPLYDIKISRLTPPDMTKVNIILSLCTISYLYDGNNI
uniref:Uncharacterized protein n=1 Tax=Lactuca sativa TaxID=4236 RepID=A0A9R1XMX0_LACSA|nr:hypothetical protein LSAT_V11C400178060 [Lactuca sativa]